MAIDSFIKKFGKGDENDPDNNMDYSDRVIPIDVNQLKPNPYQPRKQFDEFQMEELTRSIAELGVIHPIVVRPNGDIFEIVAGERRWRAAMNAKLDTIPALIRDFTDQEMAQIAIVENLQRADLNYFEEAEGYRILIDDFKMTQEEVAKKVGKSQPTIANKLRVLNINPNVREQIMVEIITERHVRALLRLETPEEQKLILKEIYENELTVSKTEQLISDYLDGRVVFLQEEELGDGEAGAEEETDLESKKGPTIHRIFSDMRIYVNTIKAAFSKVVESGVDAQIQETETEEGVTITITIPK